MTRGGTRLGLGGLLALALRRSTSSSRRADLQGGRGQRFREEGDGSGGGSPEASAACSGAPPAVDRCPGLDPSPGPSRQRPAAASAALRPARLPGLPLFEAPLSPGSCPGLAPAPAGPAPWAARLHPFGIPGLHRRRRGIRRPGLWRGSGFLVHCGFTSVGSTRRGTGTAGAGNLLCLEPTVRHFAEDDEPPRHRRIQPDATSGGISR